MSRRQLRLSRRPGHAGKHFVLRAERLHRPARHHQHLVEIGQRRRDGGRPRRRCRRAGARPGSPLPAPRRRRRRDWSWARRARPGTDRRRGRAPARPAAAARPDSAAPPSPTRVWKPSGSLRIIWSTPAACAAARMSFGFGVRGEAGNVFGNRAVEQLDVLRQIADVAAQSLDIPLLERRLVETDRAAQRRPGADEGTRQRRLAGRARSDHAQPGARVEREGDVVDERLLLAGRGDRQRLDRQRAASAAAAPSAGCGRQRPSASSTAAHSSAWPT